MEDTDRKLYQQFLEYVDRTESKGQSVIKKDQPKRLSKADRLNSSEDGTETGPKKPCTGCVHYVVRHLRHVDGYGDISTVKSKICSMVDVFCANSKTKIHYMTPEEAAEIDKRRILGKAM